MRDVLPAASAALDERDGLLEAARQAFTGGLNVVGAVNAVIVLGLAVLAFAAFRRDHPTAWTTPPTTDSPGS